MYNKQLILYFISAYLIGAIPFGLVIATLKGVDLRKVGSGNIGATNVVRAVGKSWGMLTFALDALKGYAAVALLPLLFNESFSINQRLIAGVFAVLGHSASIFIKFKGGKGVATGAGFFIGIAPLAAAAALLIWIIAFFSSRYVSLSSIISVTLASILSWIYYREESIWVPITVTILSLLIVIRHRENITRLLNGTENRFDKKKKQTEN